MLTAAFAALFRMVFLATSSIYRKIQGFISARTRSFPGPGFARLSGRQSRQKNPGVFNASRNAYSSGKRKGGSAIRVAESRPGIGAAPGASAAESSGASQKVLESDGSEKTNLELPSGGSKSQRKPVPFQRKSLWPLLWASIALLFLGVTWTLSDDATFSLNTLDQARMEMDRRRMLLEELQGQQDELHDLLKARPSRGIIHTIFRKNSNPEPDPADLMPGSGESRDYSSVPLTVRNAYLLEAHLSANQRYLADGIGVLQAIPHRWPVVGRVRLINSQYGNRTSPFGRKKEYHGGTDLKARSGDSIVATAEGYVYRVGKHGGFGNMVHIIHPSGFETIYAHLSRIDVKKGQEVRAGDVLGKAGDTGITTGPHLHYEVRLDGKRQDPIRYMIP
tara:strand:- start:17850 stop:19025 length:1176 start_codon:yes stop_codon:yes gene_type:complete